MLNCKLFKEFTLFIDEKVEENLKDISNSMMVQMLMESRQT